MNFFKKIYCRVYQGVLRLLIPFLPYREPIILKNYEELTSLVQMDTATLLVTDSGIKNLGLTLDIETQFKKDGLNLVVYDGVVANPTTDNVDEAVKIYKDNRCDMIIGFGGGSSIDLAKAVGVRVVKPNVPLSKLKGILKVRKKLPTLVAVPTTAGTGSETTVASIIVDSETRHKYAINDFPLIPKYAIHDASLILNLPKKITSTTGMDALTHAVEAYIGKSTTKKTREQSLKAVKLIFDNLLESYNNPTNYDARKNMLSAAYLAGLAFTKSYVGYVHSVAHSLGGKYNTAHGLANAIILPVVLKKYGKAVYNKLWELGVYAGLFDETVSKEEGANLFIKKIEEMNGEMGIGDSLPEIQEEDIKHLAVLAEKEANPLYPVPVLFTAEELETIFTAIKTPK